MDTDRLQAVLDEEPELRQVAEAVGDGRATIEDFEAAYKLRRLGDPIDSILEGIESV